MSSINAQNGEEDKKIYRDEGKRVSIKRSNVFEENDI